MSKWPYDMEADSVYALALPEGISLFFASQGKAKSKSKEKQRQKKNAPKVRYESLMS